MSLFWHKFIHVSLSPEKYLPCMVLVWWASSRLSPLCSDFLLKQVFLPHHLHLLTTAPWFSIPAGYCTSGLQVTQDLLPKSKAKTFIPHRISQLEKKKKKGNWMISNFLANFFSKRPDYKYFRLCEPFNLCCNWLCSEKATVDNMQTSKPGRVLVQFFVWTWIFELHIIVNHHKILLFFLFLKII